MKTNNWMINNMSLFANILSTLPEARKQRIQEALDGSEIVNEEDLRAIVAGKTNAEVTSLWKEELHLSGLDASALAGVLVTGTSGNINDLLKAK